jgi:hypothetical protein
VTEVSSVSGRRTGIVWIAAVLCGVVAVGAAMQGQFHFSGPRWLFRSPIGSVAHPVSSVPPVPQETQHPESIHASGALAVQEAALVLSLIVVVVAVVAFLIWRWIRNRRTDDGHGSLFPSVEPAIDTEADVALEQGPDLPTLRRGLALADDALADDREPRDAIVRAWIGLQEAAEDSGMKRRPAETPTEFTSRVFDTVSADKSAANILLELYLRVRFGNRPATVDDVARARQAIADLNATWPEPQRGRR